MPCGQPAGHLRADGVGILRYEMHSGWWGEDSRIPLIEPPNTIGDTNVHPADPPLSKPHPGGDNPPLTNSLTSLGEAKAWKLEVLNKRAHRDVAAQTHF